MHWFRMARHWRKRTRQHLLDSVDPVGAALCNPHGALSDPNTRSLLSKVFFRAGKLAFLDDLTGSDYKELAPDIANKVRKRATPILEL